MNGGKKGIWLATYKELEFVQGKVTQSNGKVMFWIIVKGQVTREASPGLGKRQKGGGIRDRRQQKSQRHSLEGKGVWWIQCPNSPEGILERPPGLVGMRVRATLETLGKKALGHWVLGGSWVSSRSGDLGGSCPFTLAARVTYRAPYHHFVTGLWPSNPWRCAPMYRCPGSCF